MLRKPGPKRLGSAADYHVAIVIYDPGTYTWVGRTNREGKKKTRHKKNKRTTREITNRHGAPDPICVF